MKKTLFEDALILSTIKAARSLVRILPYRVSLAFGSAIGATAWHFTKRRSLMRKNLRAVFASEKSPDELERISQQSFRQLAMSGIELLRTPEFDKAYVQKHVRVIGEDKVTAERKTGRGILFLTGHFGSWELLNIFGSILGYPMVALARVQKHVRSDAYLNNLRRSKGSEVIHKGMPIREIIRALKAGRIVGILSDQDGGKNGTFVPFFGRLSSYPKGVASFALRTGAPIYPTFIVRENQLDFRIEVEGPLLMPEKDLPVEEQEKMILAQFAKILEQKIRTSPHQWLWAHRRWKSTPDRTIVVLSDGKAGHRNQSLAFCDAAAISRQRDGFSPETLHLKTIEVRFKSERSKKLYRFASFLFRGHIPQPRFWAKLFLDSSCFHEIISAYADVVVSTGSSVAPLNLWLARENSAKSVVVMNPGISTRLFDAVIAPKHDKIGGRSRVFETSAALTRWSQAWSAAELGQRSQRSGCDPSRKKIGFLIGGDTEDIAFVPQMFEESLCEVRRVANQLKAQVLMTTSRRTPIWADSEVKTVFSDRNVCPLMVIANEVNPENTVSTILGLSDVVVVTGESVSMVSEAISSGKPVVVLVPFLMAKLKSKYREFLISMERQKLVSIVSPQGLAEVIVREMSCPSTGSAAAVGADREILVQVARKMLQ